ncbi:unnamed protein product [Protopolystoma xenopodis]|uniref:Uncharacterized protein n=1 Tax=Protopolystoma xenopodis TaxID=117903 RepID=A0A448WJI1_9PLAT|nr:unnamed protein product [Protopolystoma xenopodis]
MLCFFGTGKPSSGTASTSRSNLLDTIVRKRGDLLQTHQSESISTQVSTLTSSNASTPGTGAGSENLDNSAASVKNATIDKGNSGQGEVWAQLMRVYIALPSAPIRVRFSPRVCPSPSDSFSGTVTLNQRNGTKVCQGHRIGSFVTGPVFHLGRTLDQELASQMQETEEEAMAYAAAAAAEHHFQQTQRQQSIAKSTAGSRRHSLRGRRDADYVDDYGDGNDEDGEEEDNYDYDYEDGEDGNDAEGTEGVDQKIDDDDEYYEVGVDSDALDDSEQEEEDLRGFEINKASAGDREADEDECLERGRQCRNINYDDESSLRSHDAASKPRIDRNSALLLKEREPGFVYLENGFLWVIRFPRDQDIF